MAESVLRLRVENKEFDDGVRSATKGLKTLVNNMYELSGKFTSATKSQVEYVRSMGKMETESTSAKGRLNELTKAYKELQWQMQSAAKGQHDSDLFKAMQKAAQDLKPRIEAARAEVENMGKSSANSGNALDTLAGKFGVSTSQLVGWGAALTAGKVALDVVKDAFLSTESGIDEWGRTVAGAEAAYQTFLDTINGGGWSNFLDNLQHSISSARELYDTLDRLSSIKQNNAAAIAIEQKALAEARVKMQEAQAKGDKAHVKQLQDEIKAHEGRLSELRQQETRQSKKAGIETIKNNLQSVYRAQGGNAVADESLTKVAKDIATRGQAAYDEWANTAKVLGEKAKATRQVVTGSAITGDQKTTTETYTDWSKLTKQEQNQLRMARAVLDKETANAAGINLYAQGVQGESQSAQESFRYNRQSGAYKAGGSGSGKSSQGKAEEILPEGSIAEVEAKIKKLGEEWKKATTAGGPDGRASIAEQLKEANAQLDVMSGKMEGKTATFTMQVDASQLDELKEKLPEDATVTETVNVDTPDMVDIAVTANTTEAAQSIEELTRSFSGREIEIAIKPKTEEGFSGASDASVKAWIAGIQQSLAEAEWGTPIHDALRDQLADATAFKNIVEEWTKAGLDMAEINTEGLWQKILNAEDIDDGVWRSMADTINEKLDEIGIQPIKIDIKTGNIENLRKDAKNLKQDWENVADAIGAIGNVFNQIEDPAAKAMGTVLQAIATVALSYSQALVKAQEQGGPWGWIAFAATGAATMISTIATIKQHASGSFAEGGIVPGNYNAGKDNTYVYASPGELILNRAQQQNLAAQLTPAEGAGGGSGNSYISGEMIVTAVNNYGRRTGRGEILV